MKKKTFFISASSIEFSRLTVIELAEQLRKTFGWKWYNDWDWATALHEREENATLEVLQMCAHNDRISAAKADVFIYLQAQGIDSIGANREYGVRWGLEKKIYRVSKRPAHIFDMLPNVTTVPDIDALIEKLVIHE